jgi:hypothetical protein
VVEGKPLSFKESFHHRAIHTSLEPNRTFQVFVILSLEQAALPISARRATLSERLKSVYRRKLSRNVVKLKLNQNPLFTPPPTPKASRTEKDSKQFSHRAVNPLYPTALHSPPSFRPHPRSFLFVAAVLKLFPSPQRNKVIKLKRKCFGKC